MKSLLALLLLLAATLPLAGQTNVISYQGYLAQDGTPVDGERSLTFTIYTRLQGGTNLWSETHDNVSVNQGVFTVLLGSTVSLDSVNFGTRACFIAVTVDGVELTPRQQIASAPSALTLKVPADIEGSSVFEVLKVRNTFAGGGIHAEGTDPDSFGLKGTGGRFGVYGEGGSYGLYGLCPNAGKWGVLGQASADSGTGFGVYGVSNSPDGVGVYGSNHADTGDALGIVGTSHLSDDGIAIRGRGNRYGVQGLAIGTTGENFGVWGTTDSPSGWSGWFEGGRGLFSDRLTVTYNSNTANPHLNITEDETVGYARLQMQNTSDTTHWTIAAGGPSNDRFNVWSSRRGANVMSLRATGDPLVMANGAKLTAGGVWTDVSSARAKTRFQPVDELEVLEKVSRLPVQKWSYKVAPDVEHMGPTAEDFHDLFGLGADDAHLASLDSNGVALAAIRGLYRVVKKQEAEIAALRKRVDELTK